MRTLKDVKVIYDTEVKRYYSLKTRKAKKNSAEKLRKLRWEFCLGLSEVLKQGQPIPQGDYTMTPICGGGMGIIKSNGFNVKVVDVYSEDIVVSYTTNDGDYVCKIPVLSCGIFGSRNFEKLIQNKA